MSDLHAAGSPPDRFATTCWSLVLAAGGPPGDDLREALGALVAAYWAPLYGFIRGRGYPAHEAEDLAQGFFARLLEKGILGEVDRRKGRFRAFLLAACKDYLANRRDHDAARKRGGGRRFVPLDAEARAGPLPASGLSPEAPFDRRWALALLDRVLGRLDSEMRRAGKTALFGRLSPALLGDAQAPAYAEIASDLGMTEGAVKVAAHRLRGRYRDLLREEIARTVADPS